MAGARNTEGAALDTAIDAVMVAFVAYDAVSISGEKAGTASKYFIRSMFNKMAENASLENRLRREIGLQQFAYTPAGNPDIVIIDPNSIA